MSAIQIIRDIETTGGKIFLLDGSLKLSAARGTITPRILENVKIHKTQIINFLSGVSESTKPKLDPSVIPDDSPNPSPPIRLTTPSGEGQNPLGLTAIPDSFELSLPVRTIPPIGGKPPETDSLRFSPRKAETLSPIALAWLQDNRQALKKAGWTAPELYQRGRSKGIAWCSLWDRPFLKAYLCNDGTIEFEFVDGGRDCHQTAHPMPQRPTRAKKGVGRPIIQKKQEVYNLY